MMLARSAAKVALAGAVALASLGGCITERTSTPSRGVPVPPGDGTIPPGGVGVLAGGPKTLAHTRFAVIPLGVIRYDGMTLPLISPNGTRIASQMHRPPGWPAILATPGEHRAGLCRVSIFKLGSGNAVISSASDALPRGLLLGRSADNTGFLVESPQDDGSRWIGRCDWETGSITWLVQEQGVCAAHAIMLDNGTLAYTARRADEPAALMITLPGQQPVRLTVPGATLMFPLATPAQDRIAAIAASEEQLELACVDLRGPAGPIIARTVLLADSGSPHSAYIAVAGSQAVIPRAGQTDWGALAESVTVVLPRFSGAASVDVRTGEITRLPRRTQCATPVASPKSRGLLLGTGQDLRYAPWMNSGLETAARVLTEPHVPRVLEGGQGRVAAFGQRRTPTEPALSVIELREVE